MIAIAVVASLVAYAWVMGYIGFQTAKTGQAIQIQSSAFNTEGTELTVYVQNVGQGAIQLNYPDNTVYVNDVPIAIIQNGVAPSEMLSGNTITVKEGQTVGLTVSYIYTSGEQLKIKIVTVGGTIAQGTSTGNPSSTTTPPSGNVAPSADFTFSATNLVVQFTDASSDSDGTIASRAWNFGDTQTSTETNPSHTYASAGTYTVRLTVTDNDGATDYQEYPVTVSAAALPSIYVTSNSAVHDSNVGTHSSFANMQNDGSYDTLTEANTVPTTTTMGTLTNTGTSYSDIDQDHVRGQAFTAPADAISVASVTFYGRTNSGTFNVKAIITDSTGHILTNGISTAISCTTSEASRTATFATPPTITAGTTYWILIVSQDDTFRLYYVGTTGGTSQYDNDNSYSNPTNPTDASSGTYNYRAFYATVNRANYQLDSEVQFSGVTNFASYTQLQIKTGTLDTENLQVYYWSTTSSSWQLLGTLTANTVNTYTVSLTGTTFDLRFYDTTRTSDTTQSAWQIDYVRLVAP